MLSLAKRVITRLLGERLKYPQEGADIFLDFFYDTQMWCIGVFIGSLW